MGIDLRLEERNLHLPIPNGQLALFLFLALQPLEISDDIVNTNSDNVLVVKAECFPTEQFKHVFFPVIKVHQAIHVVGKEIRKSAHGHEEKEDADHMPNHLYYRSEIGEPVRPQKNENDKHAQ